MEPDLFVKTEKRGPSVCPDLVRGWRCSVAFPDYEDQMKNTGS